MESWAATYAHFEINRALELLPHDLTQTLGEELSNYRNILSQQSIRDTMHGLIVSAATCWSIKQLGHIFLENSGIDLKIVRYEDLVHSPREVLTSCCEFLELDWEENLLNHHKLHSGKSIGDTRNDRAIDSQGVFSAISFFNIQELNLIDSITKKISEKFDYPFGLNAIKELKESQTRVENSLPSSYELTNFLVERAKNTNNYDDFLELTTNAINQTNSKVLDVCINTSNYNWLKNHLHHNLPKNQDLLKAFQEKLALHSKSKRKKLNTYIHIGQHKTGTTSIQNYLKENREILIQRGLYIPDSILGIAHPSHYILNIYSLNANRSSTMKDHLLNTESGDFLNQLEDNLKKEIERHYHEATKLGCKDILWTNEGLYLLNSEEEYLRLQSLFKNLTDQISCICCFRELESYKESYRQQLIKQKLSSVTIKDSYRYIEDDSWLFDYPKKKHLLEKAFEKSPIYLDYQQDDMVRPFLGALGYPITDAVDIRLNETIKKD